MSVAKAKVHQELNDLTRDGTGANAYHSSKLELLTVNNSRAKLAQRLNNSASAPNNNMAPSDKQVIISKLRNQNEKLKAELKVLSSKLEEFVERSRHKKQERILPKEIEKDSFIKQKESELRQSQQKIQFYKKEIDTMRRQLEGSYNIQKIIQLEDEQKDKERILKQLQEENQALMKV